MKKIYLKKLSEINDLDKIYDMYQEIPSLEIGSLNKLNGLNKFQFKNELKKYIEEENVKNIRSNSTCNRYILFVGDYPVGEIGIRTTLNDFWINKGSQIFYKIRPTERNKGYGTIMLQLVINECKKLNFSKLRINCDDNNICSKRVIEKNNGILDIRSYNTELGTSSSYIVNLKNN